MAQPQQTSNETQPVSGTAGPSASQPENDHSGALEQLSSALISAGFLRRPLPSNTLHGGSLEGQELLLKSVWSMLGSRSKDATIRESLMAKQREILYEHTRLEGFLSRSEKQKLEAEQEATACSNRANATQKELETEKRNHRKTRDDLIRLKNAEKLIRTTSVHELRKKTNELEELQRRLTKLANSKDITSARTLTGSQTISSWHTDNVGGGRVGLLEFDLLASKDSNEQLRSENQQLRACLDLYESQLVSLMSEISGDNEAVGVTQPAASGSANKENKYIHIPKQSASLPTIYKTMSTVTYRLRDKILDAISRVENSRSANQELYDNLKQEQEQIQTQSRLYIQSLEIEVESLKKTLQETETAIERWTDHGLLANKIIPMDGLGDASRDQSLDVGRSLQIQAEALSVERKRFTEEAINLARQRTELEMRKLDEERKKILAELDFDTPARPAHPPLPAPEPPQASESTEDKTLESLVIYTRPSVTAAKLGAKTGKPKSTMTKALNNTQTLKHKPITLPTLSKPTTKGRTTILKSLLSMTGEEAKVEGGSLGASRSSPRLKTSVSASRPNRDQPSNRIKTAATITRPNRATTIRKS